MSCWVPQVIATANDAGLIQVVPDAVSLHSLREKWGQMSGPSPAESSLAAFFCAAYGPPSCETHKKAQQVWTRKNERKKRQRMRAMARYAVGGTERGFGAELGLSGGVVCVRYAGAVLRERMGWSAVLSSRLVQNFIESMAAYAVVCYLLKVAVCRPGSRV
eukprot:3066482-Rhodomonas_salina.2